MAAIKTQLAGCPLESCPEAYSRSLKCFKASLEPGKHPTTECIESHVTTMIRDYIGELLEDHSPFRILSVGSGNGPFHLISTPPRWKRFSEGSLIVISEGVAASAPLIF